MGEGHLLASRRPLRTLSSGLAQAPAASPPAPAYFPMATRTNPPSRREFELWLFRAADSSSSASCSPIERPGRGGDPDVPADGHGGEIQASQVIAAYVAVLTPAHPGGARGAAARPAVSAAALGTRRVSAQPAS